jgi:SAM-dependent methyltransferase
MDAMLHATAAAEDRHFWFKGLRRHGRALLGHALAGRTPRLIVDCGAGTGRNLDWLSALGPAIGVELSPTALAYGRQRGRRLVRATLMALPFADESVDVATSFDVLYAFDAADGRRAVAEMRRILRPGGIAAINLAALDILKGSHSKLTEERTRYTRRGLRALLTESGFEIERLTFTNMTPFPFALAVRVFERLTGRDRTGSAAALKVPPAPVNAAFDALLALEAAWLRIGNLPVGSSLFAVVRKQRS